MLGEELIGLHENPRLVPPFTERYPDLTAEAGYAAAQRLHEHRLATGWRPVGRKIGFTNRNIWPLYGVYQPIWGYVYDRTLIAAEDGTAEVPLAGLLNPRIEPEVCFSLGSSPRSAKLEDLLACIAWVAHACEIVQCPHPGWKLKLADSTASNGLHGRLVVGPRVSAERITDLANALPGVEAQLFKGGTLVERGRGENVLGSPLLALGHLVNVLAAQGLAPLSADEIVTTGTLTDAHPVAPGELWHTGIVGLPLQGLRLRFS
jgi:2-oxo-3-hexenedioate decarboxylase